MVGHARTLIAPPVAPVVPPQAKAEPKAGSLPPWTKIASPATRSRTVSPVSPSFSSDQPDGQYDEYVMYSDGVKHYFSQKYDHIINPTRTRIEGGDEHDPTSADDDFTMDDLPAGSQTCFISDFVPRLCDSVGTLVDPLNERFGRAIHRAIQTTWDTVFPTITHEVKDNDDAVFYMVSSHISDVF